MILQLIETSDEFAALLSEWDELLRDSRCDCVFLTHEWLFTWWKHVSEDRVLSLVLVRARASGQLLAVAPLTIRGPQYSRMMPRLLEFLGSGVIGSDYLDLIVRSGQEPHVLPLLASHFEERNLMLQLGQLRRTRCNALELGRHLEARQWLAVDTAMNVCPFVELSGHTWESYLATLGSSQRYNFQRRLKNLMKNFSFRLELASSHEDARKALHTLIALHRRRWEARGGESEAFRTCAVAAFHGEFIPLALDQGWLRLFTLWLNDVPAASLYGLLYGGKFYFYQSGFDPEYGKQSIGLVMMGLAIKSAIEEGATEYDFLHGDEEYKFHWARGSRELGRLEFYPPRTRGLIYRHAIDLNRAARKMARRVLIRS